MRSEQEQLLNLHLVRRIATGGMGEVWEARHTGPRDFEKRLAVKKILPHLTEDEEFINMFLDEGRLVAQLDHPNICQLFRLEEADGTYFMEMEYVDGVVLTELIDKASRRQVMIPVPHLCEVAIGVCAGLEYAHTRTDESGTSLGIIHRDISPPNIMLSTEGYVKILDFGIAKARTRLQKTQPGLLKGKLGYVSPEQVQGMDIDHRSDVFCLGILLWELATCRRLFFAKDEFATLRMISDGRYRAPSAYREDLPPELEWIIVKALSVHREDRFQTCGELQQALEDFLFRAGLPSGQRRLAKFSRRLFAGLPLPDEVATRREEAPVTQPQVDATASTLKEDAAHARPSAARHRVLITDDEQEILDAVEMILSSGGYDVEVAHDGMEAVEKVRAMHFDVCMLDLDMPRLDGRGALEQIRGVQPSLPCIIQTANDSFHMATEMGRRGAVTYLLKPARRKALLVAVQDALYHRPSGGALDALWLSDFPTPLAEARSRFRELSERQNAAKVRHALLAAHFELLTAWISALALATYLQDGAFSPTLNQQLQENAAQFTPDTWLLLFAHAMQAYRETNRPYLFRPLIDLFTAELWSSEESQEAIQTLHEKIGTLLSSSPASEEKDAWDAMLVLAAYHREMWRHDALLDDRDVDARVAVIDAFLAQVQERTYRMIDYNLVRVESISASPASDSIQHELLTLRGMQPENNVFHASNGLEARSLYLFKLAGKPLLALSPFLISSPCTTDTCQRTAIAFPVQIDPKQEVLYRCSRCGLLRRPGSAVQQSLGQLFERLAVE